MTAPTATVNSLPRRRGVVMRDGGISDSYGTRYARRPDGSLVRTGGKHPVVIAVDRLVDAVLGKW